MTSVSRLPVIRKCYRHTPPFVDPDVYFRFSDGQLTETLPAAGYALKEPNGLVAAGGVLDAQTLIAAYSAGIFPWFNDDEDAVLWWSPDPRAVIDPQSPRITRSLAKRIRSGCFQVTADTAFAAVIAECAAQRADAEGTWITANMSAAYLELHRLGYAHSVEVWENRQLVGGLYGVALGGVFFGESMFFLSRDASKVALVKLAGELADRDFGLIDAQVSSAHLTSLGAIDMPRKQFLATVAEFLERPGWPGLWTFK
ncbi:MAG: leucyl/phenylalanyl-tRNA--protein transferase [Gammaproteobacteria bacterium]|nr:MAG: leucyl/phenylalanyl-tRNA--protein transferase [Gammaproteobacteria bacterium]